MIASQNEDLVGDTTHIKSLGPHIQVKAYHFRPRQS